MLYFRHTPDHSFGFMKFSFGVYLFVCLFFVCDFLITLSLMKAYLRHFLCELGLTKYISDSILGNKSGSYSGYKKNPVFFTSPIDLGFVVELTPKIILECTPRTQISAKFVISSKR